MIILKYSVGIDIGKKEFHVCISTIDGQQQVKIKASRKFNNTVDGYKKFKEWFEKNHKDKSVAMHFVMEASGVYYEQLAHKLYRSGNRVSIILANYANKYLLSLGQNSKNDKMDAKGLAQMGAERSLTAWNPPVEYYANLRAMTRHYQSLMETKTAEQNKLEAANHTELKNKVVISQHKQLIKKLEAMIATMSKKIILHLKSDEELSLKVKNICKIKGVGELTIAVIIAETYGFELFENAKQLISYAGYDVIENQSGSRQGKTRISKKGNSRIRRAMHLPSFSVVKHKQTSFHNLYHRNVEKHGIKMKSYVAVQKKLLTTIYALWKSDKEYDNQYHNGIVEQHLKKKKIVAPDDRRLQQVQAA